ncbi:MAG: hypothetical protein ABJN40_01675 [Sneathiella sp.]
MTETSTPTDNNKKPDWTVKSPKGHGRYHRLETIGAGWSREDSGICVRLSGTQIVENDLYIYPVERAE